MKKLLLIFLTILTMSIIATRFNNKKPTHHKHAHRCHHCGCEH